MNAPTNKTQNASFRQRGYLKPGTQEIETVYGASPAPAGMTLVWDHWIVSTSTTVDYANQDVAVAPPSEPVAEASSAATPEPVLPVGASSAV
jgi:hypothetical protein